MDVWVSWGASSWGELPADQFAPAGTTTFYFSSHGFRSAPTDTPANQHFRPRLLQGFTIERSVIDGAGVSGGGASLAVGELALWNGDGALDDLVRNYAVDGRPITIKAVPSRLRSTYADAVPLFTFLGGGWNGPPRPTARLKLVDITWRLATPLQADTYASDAGDALAGKPKPIALGHVLAVPGVLEDAATNTFRVSSRRCHGIYRVQDRAVDVTLVTGTPGLGEARVYDDTGRVVFGFTPEGPVSIWLEGDADGLAYDPSVRGLIRKVCQDFGPTLTDADIDLVALDRLAVDVPGDVGYWVGADPISADAALYDICARFMGHAGATADNRISAGIVKPASGVVQFALTEDMIAGGVEEMAPPGAFYPPPTAVKLGYGRNWSWQAGQSLADTAPDDNRAFLAQQWRTAGATVDGAAAAYLLSKPTVQLNSIFTEKARAEARAAALATLLRAAPARRFIGLATRYYFDGLEIGDCGTVRHRDLGSSTLFGTVVKTSRDYLTGIVKLILMV